MKKSMRSDCLTRHELVPRVESLRGEELRSVHGREGLIDLELRDLGRNYFALTQNRLSLNKPRTVRSPSCDIAPDIGCTATPFASQAKLSQHPLIFRKQANHNKLQPNDHKPPRRFQYANTRIPLRSPPRECVFRPMLLHANQGLYLCRRVVIVIVDRGNILILVLRLHHGELRNE